MEYVCALECRRDREREQGICDTKREALEWRGGGGVRFMSGAQKFPALKVLRMHGSII